MKPKVSGNRPNKIQAEKLIGQVVHRYKSVISDKESIFYSLSIGFSRDPLREEDFKFTSQVHEEFAAFPLVNTVSHHTNFIQPLLDSPNMPIFNPNVIRHAEQKFTMIKGKVDLSLQYEHQTRITDCIDKGKNAIIWYEVRTFAEIQGKRQLICIGLQSLYLIGMGGFGFKGLNLYPAPISIPKRNSDIITKVQTFPNQAFYYRLTGDRNPLHIDPKVSIEQKLDRPIIHGMATYGSVARVFVQQILKNDELRFVSYHARFVGHVYPGQTLSVSFWKIGEDTYAFEAETIERKTKVLVGNFVVKPTAKL